MDIDLGKWYRCQIDKKEFKKLCKKSDWQGFKHMIIYFSFLALSGYLAYATWGTCLLYTSPSPRDQRGSRMPSSA